MRKLISVIAPMFCLLFNNPLQAQSKISGTAKLPPSKSSAGISILLLNSIDSSLIKGSVTETTGDFHFDNIPAGHYLLNISYTGFKTIYSKSFELISTAVYAGDFQLEKEEKELTAVTVVARKAMFEQKIDRMVINVKNSITSAGGTALEVLEKSPGVIVNHQSNSISLSGKEGVRIMINGKITQMPMDAVVQMLGGMNASNIDRIELITTPPANFDAEGNAGYINIILISNPNKGLNGSYSLTAGYGHGYTPAGAINFNYRNKKINLFGDYSFTWNNVNQDWFFSHRYFSQGIQQNNNTTTNRHPEDGQQNARIGIDVQASPKTIVGFLIGGYTSKWIMKADNKLSIFKNNIPDTSVSILNHESNKWQHFMGNINYAHTFGEGEVLSADIDYLYYKDNNPNDYHNNYYNNSGVLLGEELTRSTKLTPLNFWVGKIDYTRKFGKKINAEAGAKIALSKFTNDVAVESFQQNNWVKDPELTAKYHLEENIGAVYTSFNIEASAKTSVKLGLRYEYTTSNLSSAVQQNIVDRKYGRFFPSVFFSQKLNDKNSFNLSYSRRITRPTFKDMAPFVIFIDPYTFFSGNSGLQPAFSNVYKVDYLLKNFVFSISYTKEDGSIANFQPKNSNSNKQILAAENLDNIKTVNISLSLPITITKWWNMQNNIQGNWQQINATYPKGPFELEQKNFSLNSSQNFILPKNFSMEFSGFYQSKALFGASVTKPFGIANFGLQKKFKDSKNKLRFAVEDIFNTTLFKVTTDIPSENIYSSANLRFGYRTFKLTLTHNFGKSIKEKRDRTSASEEEQGRVK
ncbi:MAG: outer membrane beta-barrel protein [Ferruginibacter sp.]